MGLEYYALDTETTGLASSYNEINQISVVRASDKKQILIDIKVEHPERANAQALEIQGKTKADLLKGIPLLSAIEQVDAFFEEDGKTPEHRCVIAHNAPFDRKFCHAEWDIKKKAFKANLWLCTKQFAQRYVKKNIQHTQKIAQAQNETKVKYGLNNFMKGVGIPIKLGAHNAGVDAENALDLFNWLVQSKTEYVSLITRNPHKEDVQSKEPEVFDY
jgi:DNA polymerase III epsilon subunit-like protein